MELNKRTVAVKFEDLKVGDHLDSKYELAAGSEIVLIHKNESTYSVTIQTKDGRTLTATPNTYVAIRKDR
jgi:hypothetical protein